MLSALRRTYTIAIVPGASRVRRRIEWWSSPKLSPPLGDHDAPE